MLNKLEYLQHGQYLFTVGDGHKVLHIRLVLGFGAYVRARGTLKMVV